MEALAYAKTPAQAQQIDNEVDALYIKSSPQLWVYNQKLVTVLSKNMTNFYSSDLPEFRFWEKA